MTTIGTTSATLNALWDEFLARWPLASLRFMRIEDYTHAGSKDCFTYWLESRTEDLGSIWGGSAFKFGVFSRKDLSAKDHAGSAISYSATHGWLTKYGPTAGHAFDRVNGLIADIAEAAHAGRLEDIDDIDLGHATKWKIAFLYQDRTKPLIVPVFKRAVLDALSGVNPKATTSQVYRELMASKPKELDVLEFGANLWQKASTKLEATVSTDDVLHYLQTISGLTAVQAPTTKGAGFRLADGRELCLIRARKKPVIFFQPGRWTDELPNPNWGATLKGPDETRSSALPANAPSLAMPNPAVSYSVPSRERLLELLEAYTGDVPPAFVEDAPENSGAPAPVVRAGVRARTSSRSPLNQILYGPPGTGKTFGTIDAALEILDPVFWDAHRANRGALKARFDALTQDRRVRFVTFHQSFSYEDFVEGIRAQVRDNVDGTSTALTYAVERGVFADLCADALRDRERERSLGVREDATVWKLSLSEANSTDSTRQYCLENHEARIGWEMVKDASTANLTDPALGLGPKDQASIAYFAREMQVGDLVLCLKTLSTIRAVGVVTGDYEYQPQVPAGVRGDYVHKRAVRWLATDLDFDIRALNGGKQLTQPTVYPLVRMEWHALLSALRVAGVPFAQHSETPASQAEPYVLVIDEINRGNISRIFGELITLIEPSKRAGAPEALEVVLPYSKKPFSVPDNVYLIGTMNTADRSLTSMDVALRRRFDFIEMPPKPEELKGINVEGIEVDRLLDTLNQRIEALLDRDHRLGHAFFLTLREQRSLEKLGQIFRKQVLPLLQEYFFDDWQRIQWVLNDHRKPRSCQFVQATELKTQELFGADVNVAQVPLLWSINTEAFDLVESYLGVIDHRDAVDAE